MRRARSRKKGIRHAPRESRGRGTGLAIALGVFFLGGAACLSETKPLQRFAGVELLATEFNDGDSFLTRLANPATGKTEEHVLRLYFVDCNEVAAARESDKRRVREQSRYFGIDDTALAMEFGRRAAEFVRGTLAERFTVHTSFALAEGSSKPRVFAFVTTADGRDLAELLVEKGLARNFGVDRETPAGVPAADHKAHLGDVELRAAMKGAGIWKHSDPDRVVALREEQRAEMRELSRIGRSADAAGRPMDLNTASVEELVRLPGIGKVIAERIVDARPFRRKQDLLKINGIGEATYRKLESLITAGDGR